MTVETAETTSPAEPEKTSQEPPQISPAPSEDGTPARVEPDLDFIRALGKQGGGSVKNCFQCGTCSATCALSPDAEPFPRKEMAWAVWGMKNRLLEDPDVWLCHQCNDCSTRCPRGARPGDVLAAVRQETVAHYAVPRVLGRWVNEPCCVPLLLGIPAALLTVALYLKGPIESMLGISGINTERIVFSYSSMLPHWLINSFFGLFSLLVLLAVVASVKRFWRAMEAADARVGIVTPAKGLRRSIVAVLKNIVTHDKFTSCTKTRSRSFSHLCVFFGFLALSLVAIWVITAKYNPLIPDGFIYPFWFWDPWKILANAAGAAIVAGCVWMAVERLRDREQAGTGTFSDWSLLATLLAVVITGFIAEAFHYIRLEPHRHVAYFVHLVFVFALLMYLPYSKFAHVVYRTTAMVYAEYSGRDSRARPAAAVDGKNTEKEEEDDGGEGSQ